MLQEGQPVYYTTSVGGYEEGQRLASTTADYINYDMEHGAADMRDLREFMQGLVDAGPTASGHRTPAVIVTLPVLGLDEASMRANYWVIHQALAAGVHGILLCHVREAEAAEVFVAASRYPFAPEMEGIEEGLRGSGSQGLPRASGACPRTNTSKWRTHGRSIRTASFFSGSRSRTVTLWRTPKRRLLFPGLPSPNGGPETWDSRSSGCRGPAHSNFRNAGGARTRVPGDARQRDLHAPHLQRKQRRGSNR